MFRLILVKAFHEREGLVGRAWDEIPVPAAWGVLIFVCLLSLVILNARLHARESVRG